MASSIGLVPIKPAVLAVRVIPQVDTQLRAQLDLAPHHNAVGIITCDIDDCLYVGPILQGITGGGGHLA